MIEVIVTNPTVSIRAATAARTNIHNPEGYTSIRLNAAPLPGTDAYTLEVTADAWYEDNEDGEDGWGIPVTDLPGLAALIGCAPTEEALAGRLDEILGDVMLARWERVET